MVKVWLKSAGTDWGWCAKKMFKLFEPALKWSRDQCWICLKIQSQTWPTTSSLYHQLPRQQQWTGKMGKARMARTNGHHRWWARDKEGTTGPVGARDTSQAPWYFSFLLLYLFFIYLTFLEVSVSQWQWRTTTMSRTMNKNSRCRWCISSASVSFFLFFWYILYFIIIGSIYLETSDHHYHHPRQQQQGLRCDDNKGSRGSRHVMSRVPWYVFFLFIYSLSTNFFLYLELLQWWWTATPPPQHTSLTHQQQQQQQWW